MPSDTIRSCRRLSILAGTALLGSLHALPAWA